MEHNELSDKTHHIISSLQSPLNSVEELLQLLTAPLDILGLLPPAFLRYNTYPYDATAKRSFVLNRYIPKIQTLLLMNVCPVWEASLREESRLELLYQYFCPDTFFAASDNAGQVALYAYSTIQQNTFSEFSVDISKRLSRLYPVDRMYAAVFQGCLDSVRIRKQDTWEDLLKSIFSIPTKVANYYQAAPFPPELSSYHFFTSLFVRVEMLIASFTKLTSEEEAFSLSVLINKMVLGGHFLSSQSFVPNQSNFFETLLPIIRTRIVSLNEERRESYICSWRMIFSAMQPGFLTTVLSSIFGSCVEMPIPEDTSEQTRGLVKRESRLLLNLLGLLEDSSDDKWSSISAALLTKSWSISKARILVCWAALSEENAIRPKVVETLVEKTLEIWSSRQHIKYSLLSHHQYLTTILILSIYHSSNDTSFAQSITMSESFIGAIGEYIKHMDPAVRRCGMLAAEMVAARAGKSLDFQQWEGNGQGQEWARAIRALGAGRDVDAKELEPDIILLREDEGVDVGDSKPEDAYSVAGKMAKLAIIDKGADSDDDSLAGYASSEASSRPPTPTLSEMEEVEKDPTLNLGKRPVQRPVYLFDLGRLITESTKAEDPQNAERIEMSLDCAEELIRRKKSFGFELEENAVNLTHAFIFLNNNFDLDEFEERRQAALNALVACCPRKVAPTIIQEFFKNQYSTEQRFAMLTGLTMGARELAKLSVPTTKSSESRASFASKRLPQSQHAKYLTLEDMQSAPNFRELLDHISTAAIESGKEATEAKVAPLVRTRKLQIGKSPSSGITDVTSLPPSHMAVYVPKDSSFSEVAAEFFIGPLLGHFWQFLHDEQAREARSVHRETRYRGTGTGLILSPFVLSRFAECLAVLMHAARHAPEYLAVLAPEVLELALTLGTRSIDAPLPQTGVDTGTEGNTEATVLTASFLLALTVLDACVTLDGGRSLCLEHVGMLAGVGDWANGVLGALERGLRAPGGGGAEGARLGRTAAGVAMKVDEMVSKWRQSMFPM